MVCIHVAVPSIYVERINHYLKTLGDAPSILLSLTQEYCHQNVEPDLTLFCMA